VETPREGWLARAIAGVREGEHRARTAYLRRLPAPLVAALDPAARLAVRTGRRAAAVPFYLRQPLALWTGGCDGRPARVAVWGKPGSPRPLFGILFDAPPVAAEDGARSLLQVLRTAAAGADLLVAETTPALAPVFRRAGFQVVPVAVWFAARTADVLHAVAAPSRSLRSDLKLVATHGWRTGIRPPSPELARVFLERYCLPHALARFEDDAHVASLAWMERHLSAGMMLELRRGDRAEPEVMGLVIPRGRRLWLSRLGTLAGDPAVLRAGGLAALYLACAHLARDRGLPWLDLGRGRPWRSDGVVRFKWKWGYRPSVDGTQTLEYAVRVLRPGSAPALRLGARGVFVRAGGRIRVLGPDGALSDG
jgi:hypothetical protein